LKFWDASAVAPLLIEEAESPRVRALYRQDPLIIAWWGTLIECASAIARCEREGRFSPSAAAETIARLRRLAEGWQEIQPEDHLREFAFRLLRVHSLRAGDALQLAAAVVAAEGRPSSLEFVCLDDRLADAAQREGFSLTSLSRG
jgi:predicted nucleic acid-binding protein